MSSSETVVHKEKNIKRLIFQLMAMMLLIGLLPAATAAQPPGGPLFRDATVMMSSRP